MVGQLKLRTISQVHGIGQNFAKNEKERILDFYYISYFPDAYTVLVLMLFELILVKIGFLMILKLLDDLAWFMREPLLIVCIRVMYLW